MIKAKFDKTFAFISAGLVLYGIVVFSSAAFGLLSRNGPSFSSILFSQIGFGLVGGLIVAYILYRMPLKLIERYAPVFCIISLIITALVFVPHIGFSHGGARRWILVAGMSLQPSELIKITYILCLASWFSAAKDKVLSIRGGLVPYLIITLPVALLLIMQPDIGTFSIIALSGFGIYFAAGAPWKHIATLVISGILMFSLIVAWKPYARQRVMTFLDPDSDPYGSSYQIQQSLIAIGSGGLTGRGFGQSIQKFSYLPEPIGDSIFAVLGEEFGFFGTVTMIILFTLFALRGLGIARKSTDLFGRLSVVGIVILLLTQSFMNIMAVLGLIPLTGEPLAFVSHGGSALMFALANVGIVLNVSKNNLIK